MTIEATTKSAAIAGARASFGLIPFEAWLEYHKSISVLSHNVLFFIAAIIFIFMPGYFLVLGQGNEPFSRMWFLSAEERVRYGMVVKRMLVWIFAAGAFGVLWSPIFGFAVNTLVGP